MGGFWDFGAETCLSTKPFAKVSPVISVLILKTSSFFFYECYVAPASTGDRGRGFASVIAVFMPRLLEY